MADWRYMWFELHHRIIKAGHACNLGRRAVRDSREGVEVARVGIQCRLMWANDMEMLSWRIGRGCGLAVVILGHISPIYLR